MKAATGCAQSGDLVGLGDLVSTIKESEVGTRDNAVMGHLVSVLNYDDMTKINYSRLGDLLDMSNVQVKQAIESLSKQGVIVFSKATRGCAIMRLVRLAQPYETQLDQRMRRARMQIVNC